MLSIDKKAILSIIARVQQMEKKFDTVLTISNICPNKIQSDLEVQKMIKELTDYMESGQWLQDFEVDSKGDLPKDLKRGVLSEDGLYDLLSEIDKVGW